MTPSSLDPVPHVVLRAGLAALLLTAAFHKLRDLPAFRAALAGYALLPSRAVPVTAGALPAVEVGIGVALLVPGLGAAGGTGAASLLAGYAAAVAITLARGRRDVDCGCFGPGGRRRLGLDLVVRNLGLAGAAAACSLPVATRPLLWLDGVTIAGAVLALAALYVAADASLGLAPKLRALRSRA